MVSHPQQPFNVSLNIVQGKYILVQRNQAYEIDEVGFRIWELSDGNHSIEDIAHVIAEEYNIDYDQVAADCQEFIADLSRMGLIE